PAEAGVAAEHESFAASSAQARSPGRPELRLPGSERQSPSAPPIGLPDRVGVCRRLVPQDAPSLVPYHTASAALVISSTTSVGRVAKEAWLVSSSMVCRGGIAHAYTGGAPG